MNCKCDHCTHNGNTWGNIPADVQAWVSKLEVMPQQDIIKLMQEEQIKGIPFDAHSCLIAKFLEKKTDVKMSIFTTIAPRPERRTKPFEENRKWQLETPTVLKQIIDMFDNGGLPEELYERP